MLAIALLVFLPLIASIAWCSYYFIIPSRCDWDDYLIDPKIKEELSAALGDFERQHNLAFDHGGMMMTICTEAGMEVPLEYYTPLNFSKYGMSYSMSLSAIYSLESREITLQILDEYPETSDVLIHIASLKNTVTELEATPQMEEFLYHLKQEGMNIQGTVLDEFIWVKTWPWVGSTLIADLTYSTTRHSVSSYTLPNRITWRAFPEVPVIHELITEHLLINELSNCEISTLRKASANTSVLFIPGQPMRADVKLVCGDTGEERSLRLFLQPDGSYTSEVVE